MEKIKIKHNEDLVKVPVLPGDAVFVVFDRGHKPLIKVFTEVIPV